MSARVLNFPAYRDPISQEQLQRHADRVMEILIEPYYFGDSDPRRYREGLRMIAATALRAANEITRAGGVERGPGGAA